jgi:hypothetical protein
MLVRHKPLIILASPADAILVNQAGSPRRKVPTEWQGIARNVRHLMPPDWSCSPVTLRALNVGASVGIGPALSRSASARLIAWRRSWRAVETWMFER